MSSRASANDVLRRSTRVVPKQEVGPTVALVGQTNGEKGRKRADNPTVSNRSTKKPRAKHKIVATKSNSTSVALTTGICLFRMNIPAELRNLIITQFLYRPTNTNEEIRDAIDAYYNLCYLQATKKSKRKSSKTKAAIEREGVMEALFLYGDISYWDTSHITDMSKLFFSFGLIFSIFFQIFIF